MNQALVLSFLTAFFFGSFPLIARYSQMNPAWVAVTIAIGTLSAAIWGITQGFPIPSSKALLLGLTAGLINGLGIITYSKLIGGNWELSKVLPIALVLTPVVIAIGARIVFGDPITTSKVVGILFAVVAIWLLNL